MIHPTTTIINDCTDANARGRQETRVASFFGGCESYIAVLGDLEAAGNLIDALDALEGRQGVVLVNVAPRHGIGKKWPNGTPFGYFYYKNTLIVSTIDGYTLSLAKKCNLFEEIKVLDVSKCVEELIVEGDLEKTVAMRIMKSQFRSFDFVPRIAAYIVNKKKDAPHHVIKKDDILDAPHAIWWIDNFGNCKTTLFTKDVKFKPGKKVLTHLGKLTCYERLKDVPDKTEALIIGSSGLEQKRFLEITVQGISAKQHFNLRTGDIIIKERSRAKQPQPFTWES